MRWNTRLGWIIAGFVLLFAAYAATRLTHLTELPIFTDEAIYIRWSQIGFRDPNWRFISLTDGKQPMFTWVMMVLFRVFQGADPLFVGRMTSVVAGIGTLIGLWVLAYELFRDRRVAWLTGMIYIIVPFTLWYDRMALYDSLSTTFSVWGLYLAILLAKRLQLDLALILGMTLGAGMLNKSSGFLTLYFLPVTLLMFQWNKPDWWRRLLKWVGLVLVAALVSQIAYSVLRLSPFFHIVGQKDNVFIFTLSEWFDQPFRFFAGNLRGMFDWMRSYLTLPLFIVAAVPLFSRWPHARERVLLYMWWALPFMALGNFAKILYPRYILFMMMPLLILAAYAVVRFWAVLKHPIHRTLLALVVFGQCLFISYFIVVNPVNAPIPFADRGQFLDDWPAGGGVREVVAYLSAEMSHQKISVYTEGTFGLMPYSLEIYLVDNPNIKITGLWPIPEELPEAIREDAKVMPTYFVMNALQTPPNWPLTLIGEYLKGKSPDQKKLRFYRVDVPSSRLP